MRGRFPRPQRWKSRDGPCDRRGFFRLPTLKVSIVDELQAWWEICKIAGAGASVVLGPVAWILWKAHEKDNEYIRESDKNTLTVLGNLARLLETDSKDGTTRHTELLGAIKQSVELIKAHIDATTKRL